MPQEQLSQILQQLRALIPNYCDKCGSKYEPGDFELVQNDKNKTVCKLSCKKCGNSFVMHVNSSMDGMFAARSTTTGPSEDLTKEEKQKFDKFDYIETDEIIDIFTSLKDVSSIDDFNSLLKDK